MVRKIIFKDFFRHNPCCVITSSNIRFRHSNDLSERSITVAIIGLVMGIAYMAFGRNLWPLIIAHCILNSMSMVDRVL
ncbi:MAG: CPBP family intramembrane metalloprotease [Bacteroidetes bacterium]|nr:CPBP family intramembrane metalloprotease [Bacteroidota bacterium]